MSTARVILITTIAIILIAIAGMWMKVLHAQSADSWVASRMPWPIACSTRGCITSSQWALQRSYDVAFAKETGKTIPTQADTLSTMIHRHLILHASLQSPVDIKDAVRYRTAILHTTDISTIQPLGIESFDTYDSMVILPFLEQEAYMKQNNIPDTATLYRALSSQRRIYLMLSKYRWDAASGEVVAN